MHLCKPTECATLRVNHHINDDLCGILMCRSGLSVITDALLWSGMLVTEEAVCVCKGTHLDLFFSVSVNLKLL